MQQFITKPGQDEEVRRELRAAGIETVHGEPAAGEIVSPVTGRLGGFTFRRAGTHWAVDGLVPLEAAREMHGDPAAHKGLRIGGHAARPAPGQFATVWFGPDSCLRLPLGDKEETGEDLAARYPAAHRRAGVGAPVEFAADPSLGGRGFVDGYHIDTAEGLLLFANTLRRYGLG
jgi:hypothetical protein